MTLDIFNRLPNSSETMSERKIIKFSVGTVFCGVDIMNVREIINPAPVTPLPGSAPYVLGAADYRTVLVPVIDMRIRLHQPPVEQEKEKWVVVNVLDSSMALLVDKVHEVITVSLNDERDRNPLDDRANVSWIRRVYGDSTGLLFELDLAAIADNAGIGVSEPGFGDRPSARKEF